MASAQITYGTPKVQLELTMEEASALEAVLYRADAGVDGPADKIADHLSEIWDKLFDLREDDKGGKRVWPTDLEEYRNRAYILID